GGDVPGDARRRVRDDRTAADREWSPGATAGGRAAPAGATEAWRESSRAGARGGDGMTSADALAKLLDLDVHDTPVCLACLSDVVFTVDTGDVGKINGSITRMAPHLWA